MARLLPVPTRLLRPMAVPKKTLTGPGPTSVSERVLNAQALPLLGHMHQEFFEIMDDIKEGIRYAFQTENQRVLALPAGGNSAMEASVVNLVEPSDVVLVGRNGFWAERFADMVDRNDGVVRTIDKPYGEVITLDQIEQGLKEHKPSMLFLTHGESSGGVCQPLEGVADLCHSHDCLLVVDAVASLGGVPVLNDEWGIDFLYAGSQKAISATPGVAPISLSDRAWEKISRRKKRVSSLLLDLNLLTNYWACGDESRRYHHTTPISTMYALREALSMMAEEGLQNVWQRHFDVCTKFQSDLADMGLTFLAQDPATRLITVSAILVPEDINWKQVVAYANENYKVEIAGGLGSIAGKIWRIGIMGYNCNNDVSSLLIKVLGEALAEARHSPIKLSEAQARASW